MGKVNLSKAIKQKDYNFAKKILEGKSIPLCCYETDYRGPEMLVRCNKDQKFVNYMEFTPICLKCQDKAKKKLNYGL